MLYRFCSIPLVLLGMACSVRGEEPSVAEQIERRATEIIPMLDDKPFCIMRPISDRPFWDRWAAHPKVVDMIEKAEKSLENPIPVLPDALYLEFSTIGNRTNYQSARSRRNEPFEGLVLAECFENQGRFLPRIEEFLRVFASDKSWVIPAHDAALKNYNGEYTIDLTSSAFAWQLATVGGMLGEKLSPEIRRLLDEELHRRCFEPYRQSILTGEPRLSWITGKNNWNAVCLAGVTGAAVTHFTSLEDKAWFVAAAELFIQNSVEGYTDDGYCSEGVGYWCYGFGHHIRLAETLRRLTHEGIRLLDDAKLRRVACYGFTIEIAPGFSPSFADCDLSAHPDPLLLGYLNDYYGFGLDSFAKVKPAWTNNLILLGLFTDRDESLGVKKFDSDETYSAIPGLRTWFPEVHVLIARPPAEGLAVAMKGGHNAELHNHNDVGSYTVVFHEMLPLFDPGREVYTRRTFSSDRYVSDVLNSWGHSVPKVAGQFQGTGRSFAAEVVRTEFSDARDLLEIEISEAYPVEECRTLRRTFIYDRTGSTSFTIEDRVEFESPQSFEVGLATMAPWRRDGESRICFDDGKHRVIAEIDVTADGADCADWGLTDSEYEADFVAREKSRRLGIVLPQPVQTATVRVTVTPQ